VSFDEGTRTDPGALVAYLRKHDVDMLDTTPGIATTSRSDISA
jgi:hypothetical protein